MVWLPSRLGELVQPEGHMCLCGSSAVMCLVLLMLLQLIFFADSFTGLINIMTDIIWRYTGDFMAPDIVCRVVRYFQV